MVLTFLHKSDDPWFPIFTPVCGLDGWPHVAYMSQLFVQQQVFLLSRKLVLNSACGQAQQDNFKVGRRGATDIP